MSEQETIAYLTRRTATLTSERDELRSRVAELEAQLNPAMVTEWGPGPFGDPALQKLSDEVKTHGMHRLMPLLMELRERVRSEDIPRDNQTIKELRSRLASLEAPPVVPEGWEVRFLVGYWTLGATDGDKLRPAAWVREGGQFSLPLVPLPSIPREAVAALLWAHTHNTEPPHAADGEDSK